MHLSRNKARYERHRPDMWLIFASFTLSVTGVVMVYSASQYEGLTEFSNLTYLASKQLLWFGIATAGFMAAAFFDSRWVKKYTPHLGIVAIVILALVHVMSEKTLGANSRFRVGGVSIQPSEFAKLLVLLYWASVLSQVKTWNQFFRSGKDAVPLGVVGLSLLLVLKEPDMGGCSVLTFMVLSLWYLKGLPLSRLAVMMGAGALVFVKMVVSSPYQWARITAWLDPWAHQLGKGYNVIQSMMAFANGGMMGVGLGQSAQKFDYLPEQHADFIYSVIGEEFGMLGALLVAVLFLVILIRGFQIARRQQEEFTYYLATGIVTVLVGQALLNMLVAVSALPATGLTLPFVSYGGSSLVASAIMVGMLVKLSACRVSLKGALEKEQEQEILSSTISRPERPEEIAMKKKPKAMSPGRPVTVPALKGKPKVEVNHAASGAGGRGDRRASLPRY